MLESYAYSGKNSQRILSKKIILDIFSNIGLKKLC